MSTVNLESLIYDRTNDDLVNDTDKAYIDYKDLNRVEGACAELAELLGVSIQTKTWVISDWRTEADMERIRQNLIKLQKVYESDIKTKAPTAITYTSITQANDVERILHDAWMTYRSVTAGRRLLAFTLGTEPLGNREV